MTRMTGFSLFLMLLFGPLASLAIAQAEPPTVAAAPAPAAMPHIIVNREQRYVDLEAAVVMREGKWLELLACTPKSREHESVLTVPARPSHVHLALLMLGLEPGAPMSWKYEGEEAQVQLPTGPQVQIEIRYRDKMGRLHEVPANKWIIHQENNTELEGNTWLFSGSQFVEHQGERLYRADLGGTVISLVNFGDDLLSRPTDRTNMSDDAMWGCNTELIPEVGTQVTLRLRPVEQREQKADKQEAGQAGN